MKRPDMLLWLNDNRGIYIPRDFAASFQDREKHVRGVSNEDWSVLDEGPDHEFYWDVWAEVLDNAIINDGETEYFLWQDGDLWLVPKGMDWDDALDTFVWPEDETAE